jgi:hypothetical protein
MVCHDGRMETAVRQENENTFMNPISLPPTPSHKQLLCCIHICLCFRNRLHTSHLDDVAYRPQSHRNHQMSQRLNKHITAKRFSGYSDRVWQIAQPGTVQTQCS